MCELYALGHPDFSKPTCLLVVSKVLDGLSMSWATSFSMLIQIKPHEGWPEALDARCNAVIWIITFCQVLQRSSHPTLPQSDTPRLRDLLSTQLCDNSWCGCTYNPIADSIHRHHLKSHYIKSIGMCSSVRCCEPHFAEAASVSSEAPPPRSQFEDLQITYPKTHPNMIYLPLLDHR
jgi:hypothetical protein